jgi:hypothetical protein
VAGALLHLSQLAYTRGDYQVYCRGGVLVLPLVGVAAAARAPAAGWLRAPW